MLLNDLQIQRRADQGMITPFICESNKEQREKKEISKGLSGQSYDVTLSEDLRIMNHIECVVDPKAKMDDKYFKATLHEDSNGKFFILPAHSFALGHTVESFRMPDTIGAIILDKSTYARSGLQVNSTFVDGGFCGQVVLEFFNACNSPLKMYANEGIAQMLFLESEVPAISYAKRNDSKGGKYQNQTGVQYPII